MTALRRLLDTVQLTPAPAGEPDHPLPAVAAHMSAGADLARRTAARRETDVPPAALPDDRGPAT